MNEISTHMHISQAKTLPIFVCAITAIHSRGRYIYSLNISQGYGLLVVRSKDIGGLNHRSEPIAMN